MSASEERAIIEADTAVVGLQPTKEEMTLIMMRGEGLGPSYHNQMEAFRKRVKESDIAKHDVDSGESEYGNISDIMPRVLAHGLKLTNKNLSFSYRKGLFNKRNLRMIIPMEYAVLVQKRRWSKLLEIRFIVPRKEDDVVIFDLRLSRLKDNQNWLEKLNQVITENLTQDSVVKKSPDG